MLSEMLRDLWLFYLGASAFFREPWLFYLSAQPKCPLARIFYLPHKYIYTPVRYSNCACQPICPTRGYSIRACQESATRILFSVLTDEPSATETSRCQPPPRPLPPRPSESPERCHRSCPAFAPEDPEPGRAIRFHCARRVGREGYLREGRTPGGFRRAVRPAHRQLRYGEHAEARRTHRPRRQHRRPDGEGTATGQAGSPARLDPKLAITGMTR